MSALDIKGHYGKMMILFFFFGMLFIAANFYLMALGISYTDFHPW